MTTTLSVPELDDDSDTLTAALAYARAGWYVGPVRRGEKNPGGILGKGWETRTSRDPQTVAAWFAGTDDGVFLHCGRSGAVVLDVDEPTALPAMMAEAFTSAPPPYQSTRDDNPLRGHYLYAAPAGRRIGNSTGKLGRDWGEVRGANGVVVVAPSVHEKAENGGRYQWERTGNVPELPARIADALPDAQDTAAAVTNSEVREFLEQHVARGHTTLFLAVTKRLDRELAGGGSRHNAARDALCEAMREAQAGCYPAKGAVDAIRLRFGASVASERRDPGEWPGLVAWAVAQARLDDPAERRRRIEERVGPAEPPEPEWHSPLDGEHHTDQPETRPAEPTTHLPNLPDEFWERRAFLGHVRQLALSRRVCPDYVLHALMARTASRLDHRTKVDTGVDQTNLSYYTVPVGASGSGKSRGNRAAGALIPSEAYPPSGYRELALGSGEGLAEAYMGHEWRDTDIILKSGPQRGEYKKEKVKTQVRHNILFYVDEGEALMRTSERNGATIGATLRSAWRGETIGQANGREETTRLIPQDSYVLGLIVGFQPETIRPLLDDLAAGTPQRFAYCYASYPAAPRHRPPDPGTLDMSKVALAVPDSHLDESHVVPVTDPDVLAAIDEQSWEASCGIVPDPIKTQRLLLVAKSAALLTILDGRREITGDDWSLAETLVSTSDAVVEKLLERGRAEESRRTQERDDHHVALARRVEAGKQGLPQSVERIARRLAEIVHTDGAVGRSALRRKLASRDRDLYDNGLEHAVGQGWLLADELKVQPGAGRPA